MSSCPLADQSHRYDAAYPGAYTGGAPKGVLHTTEGPGLPGYKGGAEAPHLTVLPDLARQRLSFFQHFDSGRPSRALMHTGNVQTNNGNAVQIELVGTCQSGHPELGLFWPNAPAWALDQLRPLLRWCEQDRRIRQVGTGRPWLPYPQSYGQTVARMTADEWDTFSGWCGHLHVPTNDHGDPGSLPIAALLEEADMPISDDDTKRIALAVWGTPLPLANSGKYERADIILGWSDAREEATRALVAGLSADEIAAKIVAAIPADLAAEVVDALAKRLDKTP